MTDFSIICKRAIKKVEANDIKDLADGKMGHSTREVSDLVIDHIWETVSMQF
jgi:hypothetical protein